MLLAALFLPSLVATAHGDEAGAKVNAPAHEVLAIQEADPSGGQPAEEDTIPTPVRVESIPQPAATEPARPSITGDWALPLAVLAGLIALMSIRRLGTEETSTTAAPPVDTLSEAS